MDSGHIVEMGEAAQVLLAPTHSVTHELLSAVPRLDFGPANPYAG